MEQKPVRIPHVLIFPFPAQGHVNSMLKLAELLSLFGIHITFLNMDYNHDRLLKFTDARIRFSRFPGFRFETITGGLPLNNSRTSSYLRDFLHTIKTTMQPAFREMLFSGCLESHGRPPVTCVIADGLLTFTIEVAKELEIPSICFRTGSACYLWACFCIPKLIEAGEIPLRDETDMDALVTTVPGMEASIRRRDLPSFCKAKDLNDLDLQIVMTETQNSLQASAHILNTFEDLEGLILSSMSPHFPKIYTLGPIHALLTSRSKNYSLPSSSNSLLEVDRNCMTWLDAQPKKSVIYVSFGSVIFMTQKEMLEFWYGLVNSGKRFLWVIRPGSVTDKEEEYDIPEELREGTKERGYMVEWSPQEEVLRHEAVGGFLTHSGWNSTLESVVAGVPMICWPGLADQPINSRFVSEIWKVGLDMKDSCDRSTVERMVRDLMEVKREELMKSVQHMAEMARKCVSEGGSSSRNLDQLIHDIRSMSSAAFDHAKK